MIVLIDGRSGAGKTSFAGRLGALLGATVVHLDSFYPGWSGLELASQMVARDVLRSHGGGYTAWDWERGLPAGWVDHGWCPGAGTLIVEGCGSVTASTVRQASRLDLVFTMFFDGDERQRRAKVVARDGDVESWWDMWALQEQAHMETMPLCDVYRWNEQNHHDLGAGDQE